MKLSKKQRQAHIDTNTKCYGHVIKQKKRKGQLSDRTEYAKQSLLDFHNLEDFKSYKIHACHLCDNSSAAPNGYICINPHHLYFGTPSENNNDLDPNGNPTGGKAPNSDKQKKAASKTGAKTGAKNFETALKNGNHSCQQLHTCPHCGFEGIGPVIKRWHFDNCKHK